MAGTSTTIRKVQVSKVADFDDQLWPINCAILILAGFVAGIVIATSDFSDPKILYNGWTRLLSVGVLMALLFSGVTWPQGKMLRRLQFCILIRLLVQLWIAMYLHREYLELVYQRETDTFLTDNEPTEKITVPDYRIKQLDQPGQEESYQEPVETEAPVETEPEAVQQEEIQHEVPAEDKPQTEPQQPQRQQPNPAEIRRAELSAPRRADQAAGAQISRQPWKHRLQPNEPIPEPKVKPQGRQPTTEPVAQTTTVQRQQAKTPTHQRRTFEEPTARREQELVRLARRATESKPIPDRPTTPTPTRQITRPAEVPRTEAVTPKPAQVVQQPRPVDLQPQQMAVAPRQEIAPKAVRRAPQPEAAPTTSPEATRQIARQRQTDQRPQLAEVPRPAPSRQPRQMTLPSREALPQPQQVAAAGQRQASPLEAARSQVSRQQAAARPASGRRSAADAPSPAVSAAVPSAQPKRNLQQAVAAQTQPSAPAPVARQAASAPQVAQTRIETPAAAKAAAPSRPSLAATQPSDTSVTKAATAAAQVAQQAPGAALPAMTPAAQLPSAVARRANAARQQQPSDVSVLPSQPTTLARAATGAKIPSSAIAAEIQPAATPAAAGGAPASRIEATSSTAAVTRSAAAAPAGNNVAAEGTAEFAVGSAPVVARAGQARAAGSGRPSMAANSPAPQISRASSGASMSAMALPAAAVLPSVAAAAQAGGSPSPSVNAQATAAARSGRAVLPAVQQMPGSGPAGSSGTSGRIGAAQLGRVTRQESTPSGITGGGTPRQARTSTGTATIADARAEAPEVMAVAAGGGKTPGTPLEAEMQGQDRQVAGLPGNRTAEMSASGAIASTSARGAPLPDAVARRSTASQRSGGQPGLQPTKAATMARANTGTSLPAAVAAEAERVPGSGAAGVAATEGGLPSTLEVGSTAAVQRGAAADVVGQSSVAAGTAEFAAGAARVVAHAGQLRAGGKQAPALAVSSQPSSLGRSTASSALGGIVADATAEPAAAVAAGGQAGNPAEVAIGAVAAPAARGGAAGLPTGGPAETGGPVAGGTGPALADAPLSRAGRSETMVAAVGAGEPTGLGRQMSRAPAADVVGQVDEVSAAAPARGQPSSVAEGTLQAAAVGQPRQIAGLPGTMNDRLSIDSAAVAGAAATTPGTTAGLRRLPRGDDQGPSLAAEVGGGLVRQTSTPGLPRGLAEVSEQQPVTMASAAEPGETIDVAAGSSTGEPGRREGGLPVQIAAVAGPGGLSHDASPDLGVPSRRARRESEVVHRISRRFVIERSGGELAIDGTVNEPSEYYRQRFRGRRAQGAGGFRPTEGTEKAVEMGLDFFARLQFPDGHWSIHNLPEGVELKDPALGQMEADTAATGLALLSYLGAGYTHLDDKHRAVVNRGLDWLVRNQKEDGDLFSGGTKYAWLYSHGIGAIALCEGYGMTQDPELREPARKAIEFIVKAQHPIRGGWRYSPGKESDTSVSGWMLMALKSAQMAGLEVPAEALEKVAHWLDVAKAPEHQGRYVYNPFAREDEKQREGRKPSLAMTSEAMLMRMYLGRGRDDPQLIEGAEYVKENLPEVGTPDKRLRDSYYWYYATQAMFQMSGDYWTDWNDRLSPLLQDSQVQFGELGGSWHPLKPVRDRWGREGGRLYVTALNLLMLEVYYRHLPLFRELTK